MAQFRKSESPDQGLLLPPSPRDWLPKGHLAWFIQDTVTALDIDKLVETYRIAGKGELPYPPRVMPQVSFEKELSQARLSGGSIEDYSGKALYSVDHAVRRIEAPDMPLVRRVMRAAEQRDYKLSAFVQAIAASPAFQMNAEPAVETTTPVAP
mgnify:CR=1 FL=1